MAFTYPPSGGGASNLDGLTDVVITGSPATGQVLQYDGTNWANQALTSYDPNLIKVNPDFNNGIYGPKGNKSETMNWWDPNNCQGFDITFDKTMYFTDIAIVARQWPGSWAGGGVRVWIFNSNPTTGLPSTLKADLGIISVPATSPVDPWQNAVCDAPISSGLLLDAFKKYWVVTSNGVSGEGYGSGEGPQLVQVKAYDSSLVNNYALGGTMGITFQGANNTAFFFGNVTEVGGINATTAPSGNPTLGMALNVTASAPLVLFAGGMD